MVVDLWPPLMLDPIVNWRLYWKALNRSALTYSIWSKSISMKTLRLSLPWVPRVFLWLSASATVKQSQDFSEYNQQE